MSETLLALLAFSPIVVAAILLVGLNWPAKKAMPVAFALTVAIALFAWDMSSTRVLASVFQGFGITVSVLWIVFGAIFLLNTLKHTGAITTIRNGFTDISADRRVSGNHHSLVFWFIHRGRIWLRYTCSYCRSTTGCYRLPSISRGTDGHDDSIYASIIRRGWYTYHCWRKQRFGYAQHW